MMRLKISAIICFFLVTGTPPVSAEPLKLYIDTVYTDRPGEVLVVVELPPGVTPEASDFRLRIDDNTVSTAEELKPFRQLGQGLALVVCVDVSGTMKGDPLKDTKEALLSFIGEARPEDHIALVTFADHGKSESLFGDSRQHLKQAIMGLKVRGGLTRLYQTLYDSLDMFKGPEIPKRRRVIVITDGKDEGSTASAQNVITKATAARIPLDTVGRGKIADQYAEGLRGLARDTAGRFIHARPDRLDLTDAIDRIYRDLLEIRSLVIYFKYDMDDAGQTTRNALVELQLPGEAPLSVRIPDEIPLPLPAKPKEITDGSDKKKNGIDPNVYWLLLTIALLLVIGLIVWFIQRTRKNGEVPQEPEPSEIVSKTIKPPPVTISVPEPKTEIPKMTQVGGYYFPVPEPGQPTAALIGVSGPFEGRQFEIDGEVFHIGASGDNDLDMSEDEYVSGEHAYIRYQGGILTLFDKGSRNHTYVNQTEVSDTGVALNLGDRIGIGKSILEVAAAAR